MLLWCVQHSGCKTYFAVISRERKPVIMQLKLKSVPQNSARETLTVESIRCDPQEEIRDYSLLIKGVHGQSIARLRYAPFICSLKVTQKIFCSPGTTEAHREAQRRVFIDVTPHTFPLSFFWKHYISVALESLYERKDGDDG